MPFDYPGDDPELEASTNRWMVWGLVLLVLFVLAFPIYRLLEPSRRAEAFEAYETGLVAQGRSLYADGCAQCHGLEGLGGLGPALNAQQFLGSVDDDQLGDLIATGVPGTLMAPYSADFGGSLTQAQINALVVYMRSHEEDAPDFPEWRTPLAREGLTGGELYTMACAYCHASDLGGSDLAPALGPGSDAEEESDGRLAKRIREGEDEMPAFGNTLTEEQVALIVAHLRAMQDGG